MKKIIYPGLLAAFLVILVSCGSNGQSTFKKVKLTNELDSVSYALGVNVANGVKSQGLDEISLDALMKGFEDVYTDNDPMSVDETMEILNNFFMTAMERKSAKNLQEGQKFLEANKGKSGVTTTESGLQYKVLTEAFGPKPLVTSTVRVHYHGTLTDGTVFDSSVDRGEPAEFPLNGVIVGWTEGLQLMSVGSKYRFFVPSELGYGANPRPGGPIQPNMVLIFDVELLTIVE